MIPGGKFTSAPFQAAFDNRYGSTALGTTCKFKGGAEISDPSEPRTKYDWVCYSEGTGIVLEGGKNNAKHVVISDIGGDARFVTGTFDTNMAPIIAWQIQKVSFLRYYDTYTNQFVTKSISGTSSCAVFNDELLSEGSDISDGMFFFTDETNLCYQMQRERYTTTHVVQPTKGRIRRLGRNNLNRLQVQLTA